MCSLAALTWAIAYSYVLLPVSSFDAQVIPKKSTKENRHSKKRDAAIAAMRQSFHNPRKSFDVTDDTSNIDVDDKPGAFEDSRFFFNEILYHDRLRAHSRYSGSKGDFADRLTSQTVNIEHIKTRRTRQRNFVSGNNDKKSSSLIFRPIDFGADPTGIKDSTDAFDKALDALLTVDTAENSNSSNFPNKLSSNITDLGGRVLHLWGGEYKIKRPLKIPGYVGNFEVAHGTLRVNKEAWEEEHNIQTEKQYLIQLGTKICEPDYAESCNEWISFHNLLLDCGSPGDFEIGQTESNNPLTSTNQRLSVGGISVTNAMGIDIGPSVFI